MFIDAFAGTGYREEEDRPQGSAEPIFPELAAEEPQTFRDGSARIALQTLPPFQKLIFIEASRRRSAELDALRREFPALSSAIEVRHGDANTELQAICQTTNWKTNRAVVFLDPFGMQVDWQTITAIATTKAIDVWILFPVGIGVQRMLTQSLEEMPVLWRQRLTRVFGTDKWEGVFYREDSTMSLFAGSTQRKKVRVATTEAVGQYYHERLKSVFAQVAENPCYLVNSTNSPLYQLHFAVGNIRGAPIAMRIAQHILAHT